MRALTTAVWILILLATTLPVAAGDSLMSRTYKFKPDVVLDIGASQGGLRLDSVRFVLPSDKTLFRFGSGVRAEVNVSNLSSEPMKVGVAIALFDAEGRLLGVASGGSALLAIKSERQSTYTLSFKDVNDSAARATSFQISLEPK